MHAYTLAKKINRVVQCTSSWGHIYIVLKDDFSSITPVSLPHQLSTIIFFSKLWLKDKNHIYLPRILASGIKMAAELAVTGWFLSPIIREMQDTALAYIRGQFSWKKDHEKDLERLDIALTEILIIVDVIDKREIKNGNQRRLLSKLKDTIYSAVDVLDSFQYMVQQSKVDSLSVVSCVTSSCIYLGKRLIGTDSFRRKLADILEKLGEVKTTADTLMKVVTFDNVTVMTGLVAQPARPKLGA